MHANRRARKITGTGGKDKTAVLGLLERGGKLAGSAIFTDALKSYEGLGEFQYEVIDHAVEYVRGDVHPNGLENFGHF